MGRGSQSAIATLVDRTSRYLRLVPLPNGHGAQAVRDALIQLLAQLPAEARMTLTWDQGSEMAHHDRIAEHLTYGVFFAPPASPWLRGTNENTNGLLRQYFPKGTDLSVHTAADLAQVEERLNKPPTQDAQLEGPGADLRCVREKMLTSTVAPIAEIRPRTQVPPRGQDSGSDPLFVNVVDPTQGLVGPMCTVVHL